MRNNHAYYNERLTASMKFLAEGIELKDNAEILYWAGSIATWAASKKTLLVDELYPLENGGI